MCGMGPALFEAATHHVTPAKAGVQGHQKTCFPGFPLPRE